MLYILYTISTLLCLSYLHDIPTSPEINKGLKSYRLSGYAQGTTWQATYFAKDSIIHKSQVDSLLLVIDSSLSIYKPYSTIVRFNNSDRGVVIDEHFRNVVKKSLETYQQTNGLFDITVAPLVEAWGFGAREKREPPADSLIQSALSCIGSGYIQLKQDSLIKLKPCIKIDVNGIAQGYTVDLVAAFFERKGIKDYLIEIGGELRVKGKKHPDNQPFRLGIESPANDEYSMAPMQKIITIDKGAITSSGNYRRYYESGGKRISHIIHPKTGRFVDNELISVTVYAKDAFTADAYDNALMLMGLEAAMRFVETRNDMAAFFIFKEKDGNVKDTASSKFARLIKQSKTKYKKQ